MFDQQKILTHHLRKVYKETYLTTHYQSAYNQSFDRRLRKLVLAYRFNFEAIALHLTYQFPQFQYKIKKQAVAFRWYQLDTKERAKQIEQKMGRYQKNIEYDKKQVDNFKQQLQKCGKSSISIKKSQSSQDSQYQQKQQKQMEQISIQNNRKASAQQKKNIQQLQKALKSALASEENEKQGFLVYKPQYQKYTRQPKQNEQNSRHKNIQCQQLLERATKKNEKQDEEERKQEEEDDYQYGYSYSQLQQEYNHYNELISNYGLGYHDDSATNSSIDSQKQQIGSQQDLDMQVQILDNQLFTQLFAISAPLDQQIKQISLQPNTSTEQHKTVQKQQDFQINDSDYESD